MRLSNTRLRPYALSLLLVFILTAVSLPGSPEAVTSARDVTTAVALSNLVIDDGTAECAIGPAREQQGQPGFGWANRLTPDAYPATLRSITVGFNRTSALAQPNQLFRIVVLKDPEGDGPFNGQAPDASFIGRVRGTTESLMTFNLISPVTITEGSFIIGVIDEFAVTRLDSSGTDTFPALIDIPGQSDPPGSDSYITFNAGGQWFFASQITASIPAPCNQPGSWIIRGTVESEPLQVLAERATIKDPLAVEPWGVAATFFGQVVVTNYVSDNLTVIDPRNNSFQNLPVGDGPGGAPDGPFGVTTDGCSTAYVTLMGTNTIPTKEFPVDYSALGPGRVLVISIRQNFPAAQTAQIAVGRGPMFPALAAGKLYVPCSGDNRVDVIDTEDNQKIAEITVGQNPSSCTASIDGSKVYVTNFGDGTISVIDVEADRKIKDIPAPTVALPGLSNLPLAQNPWSAAVSQANGDLYVSYWGTAGNLFPNGAVIRIDTCRDEVVGAIVDDTTRGTPPGSNGATGIPAPTAPLVRDAATGTTPQAGGGGGGPFSIATCIGSLKMLFTNDATGALGVIDSRIDQVVSAPAVTLASCPKPRGVACMPDPVVPSENVLRGQAAFVACGQPDNSVHVVTVPAMPENIIGLPLVTFIRFTNKKLEVNGSGFAPGTRIEMIEGGAETCAGFQKEPRINTEGTRLVQKGRLTTGRKPNPNRNEDDEFAVFRLIAPDGTIRIFQRTSAIGCGVTPNPIAPIEGAGKASFVRLN